MLTLTQSQKQTLAAILADEVQSQREDPTAPMALGEALDLARALERGEDLNPFTLARVLAEEAAMRVGMLHEAVVFDAFGIRPVVASGNAVPLRLAVDVLAQLGERLAVRAWTVYWTVIVVVKSMVEPSGNTTWPSMMYVPGVSGSVR